MINIKTYVKLIHLMSIVANLKVKRIGGNQIEWWNMWFNAIIHVEPYQLEIKNKLK